MHKKDERVRSDSGKCEGTPKQRAGGGEKGLESSTWISMTSAQRAVAAALCSHHCLPHQTLIEHLLSSYTVSFHLLPYLVFTTLLC